MHTVVMVNSKAFEEKLSSVGVGLVCLYNEFIQIKLRNMRKATYFSSIKADKIIV
jgi:hypothetical protein